MYASEDGQPRPTRQMARRLPGNDRELFRFWADAVVRKQLPYCAALVVTGANHRIGQSDAFDVDIGHVRASVRAAHV